MEFETRSLKRKEVKALKKQGYNMGALSAEQVDDFMDLVFAVVFTPEQLALIDDLPQSECMRILNRILADTNGSVQPDEAKN
jgi:hypothetical protein